MQLDTTTIIIAVIGGFLAGVVNTLAGNGSAITLSIMTEIMGLPANVANGTNRVGVLMQSWSSSYSFLKYKKVDLAKAKWSILSAFIGAITGVIVAINVSNEAFQTVFRYLLVVMFFVILIKPKRWLKELNDLPIEHPLAIPMFFLLGFYGGFIQMGMGIVFLVVTVLILKYNLISANALKTVIVAVYTCIAVLMFHYNGLIDWKVGLTIGVGQALGGFLTAEFASKYPSAQYWAYGLLIVMVLLAILSTFGILEFI